MSRDYLRQRRQGGYVFVIVYLFVCLLATLRKNFRTDLHEIFRKSWQWTNKQMIKLWIQGLFSGFVTIEGYGKWYQLTALRDAAVQGMQ